MIIWAGTFTYYFKEIPTGVTFPGETGFVTNNRDKIKISVCKKKKKKKEKN